MAALIRRDNSFDDLFDFRRDLDGLFNRLLRNNSSEGRATEGLVVAPPIEAWVDPDKKEYHLQVALPGVSQEEVQLTLQGNSLTISGEHKTSDEKKNSNYFNREFSFERFTRTVVLPEDIEVDKISAEYNNGVLEIKAPFNSAALPKQIEIKSLPKSKATGA